MWNLHVNMFTLIAISDGSVFNKLLLKCGQLCNPQGNSLTALHNMMIVHYFLFLSNYVPLQ